VVGVVRTFSEALTLLDKVACDGAVGRKAFTPNQLSIAVRNHLIEGTRR